jgi:hypothetical protein
LDITFIQELVCECRNQLSEAARKKTLLGAKNGQAIEELSARRALLRMFEFRLVAILMFISPALSEIENLVPLTFRFHCILHDGSLLVDVDAIHPLSSQLFQVKVKVQLF